MRRIRIRAGEISLRAELDENETADAVWAALPISGRVSRFGGEVYFDVPIDLPPAPDAREVMNAGELGYWPEGPGVAIFFGPTEWSRGDEIRAYSRVNAFGRLEGDPSVLDKVGEGATITVEQGE